MKLSLAKLLRKVIKQKNQPTKPKNATKEYKNGATVAQAETSETETDTGQLENEATVSKPVASESKTDTGQARRRPLGTQNATKQTRDGISTTQS